LILGYAYPAFECFKIVEKNKPEIEQLIFWCQYWIIIATLTVLERVLDTSISWLPMYGEAKVAFILYLWYPKTKGTSYVYDAFVRPFVAKYEADIDRSIHELKTRVGDMALLYGRKCSFYVQARIFDALQYVATQSSRDRPVQNVQQFQPVIPATGFRKAGLAASSHQTGPAVAPHQPQTSVVKRQPTPSVSSQSTQGAVSESPQQPVQPAPAESVLSVSSSTCENIEEMEVDMVVVQREQVAPREQNVEQTRRMTRGWLRQRSQSNVKAD
ncbi:hypothetical protein KI387_030834, partial [Taxus chinensis]